MQTWVDFAAIRQSVSLAPLLRHYQVRLRRSGRDPYRGQCPIRRSEGPEAFHVNLSRNTFHCFSCGAGGGASAEISSLAVDSPSSRATSSDCIQAISTLSFRMESWGNLGPPP